jgi:threonine/homoserine/homoserine lactone efflux protein
MTLATFSALLIFSFVSSVTPGPNNIMLFSSGVNFGLRRTVPHMFGIAFGFGILLGAVGAGLGVILKQYPPIFVAIKVVGGAYMLWLAWKIYNSGPVEIKSGEARPMTFLAAALFQWVNPKAWVMAATAMATYTTEGNYALNVLIVVFAFCFVNFPSVSIWAGFGTAMRDLLKDPKKLKLFNAIMALALVVSLWPMLRT